MEEVWEAQLVMKWQWRDWKKWGEKIREVNAISPAADLQNSQD